MITVDAMGDVCPVPIVKTKNAIRQLGGAGEVEVFVDNNISVQNLKKMAQQKGYGVKAEQISDERYRVLLTITETQAFDLQAEEATEEQCPITKGNGKVAVISGAKMGEGSEELGAILIKSFLFALSQQDELPEAILFYNGGARLTCEGSESLEDIKNMEAAGVTILTCGTCLDFYGIKEQLRVGEITNMYNIVEKMMNASLVIRP